MSAHHVPRHGAVLAFHMLFGLAVQASFAGESAAPPAPPPEVGQTLPNGIQLPSDWPPRMAQLPRDPVSPPYLESPPEVIPIDVGRQLFVDDFALHALASRLQRPPVR